MADDIASSTDALLWDENHFCPIRNCRCISTEVSPGVWLVRTRPRTESNWVYKTVVNTPTDDKQVLDKH